MRATAALLYIEVCPLRGALLQVPVLLSQRAVKRAQQVLWPPSSFTLADGGVSWAAGGAAGREGVGQGRWEPHRGRCDDGQGFVPRQFSSSTPRPTELRSDAPGCCSDVRSTKDQDPSGGCGSSGRATRVRLSFFTFLLTTCFGIISNGT